MYVFVKKRNEFGFSNVKSNEIDYSNVKSNVLTSFFLLFVHVPLTSSFSRTKIFVREKTERKTSRQTLELTSMRDACSHVRVLFT